MNNILNREFHVLLIRYTDQVIQPASQPACAKFMCIKVNGYFYSHWSRQSGYFQHIDKKKIGHRTEPGPSTGVAGLRNQVTVEVVLVERRYVSSRQDIYYVWCTAGWCHAIHTGIFCCLNSDLNNLQAF